MLVDLLLHDHQRSRSRSGRQILDVGLGLGQQVVLSQDAIHDSKALGLGGTHLEWREELIEDYADFSRRTRKELVIARVEAILTGMPG